MLGAIIGDIVGSRFEWSNIKTKEFDFLTHSCFFTDDSVMSLAIAKAILETKQPTQLMANAIFCMQDVGRNYPDCGYGGSFCNWMFSSTPKPYNSYGNGAAMRVSACGFAASSLDEAIAMSKAVTEVTHNHPEGLKGAEATTVALYMARTGSSLTLYIRSPSFGIIPAGCRARRNSASDRCHPPAVRPDGSRPSAGGNRLHPSSFSARFRRCQSLGY